MEFWLQFGERFMMSAHVNEFIYSNPEPSQLGHENVCLI